MYHFFTITANKNYYIQLSTATGVNLDLPGHGGDTQVYNVVLIKYGTHVHNVKEKSKKSFYPITFHCTLTTVGKNATNHTILYSSNSPYCPHPHTHSELGAL